MMFVTGKFETCAIWDIRRTKKGRTKLTAWHQQRLAKRDVKYYYSTVEQMANKFC
jgi:hypothetical protein